eukprot:2392968-Ditylum_brightwellii.AAC.1
MQTDNSALVMFDNEQGNDEYGEDMHRVDHELENTSWEMSGIEIIGRSMTSNNLSQVQLFLIAITEDIAYMRG